MNRVFENLFSPRLAATVACDFRTQFRRGFYLLSAFMLTVAAATLWALPDAFAQFIPLVWMTSMLVLAFVIVGLVMLTHGEQGVLQGLSVTPLQPSEYLHAKILTLGGLSVAENIVLIGLADLFFPVDVHWMMAVLGSAYVAVLYSVLGVAVLMRYRSFNALLAPIVLWSIFLECPELQYVGAPGGWLYYLAPTYGPLLLFESAVGKTLSSPQWIYALTYPMVWIVVGYRVALVNIRKQARTPWSLAS